jgi:hypothetical protein
MLMVPDIPPVRTRLPSVAWAVAGLITLFSLTSSLLHGLASDHSMLSLEQTTKAFAHSVMASTLR